MLGYATACLIPKPDARQGTIYVDELWVAPPHRRRGIARTLLKAMEEVGRDLDLWRMRLYVAEDNQAARALYRHCFGEEESRTFFYDKPL